MADRRFVVAVTGAAGLIGGILAERLSGVYDLRLLDRIPIVDRPGMRVDLADLAGLERALRGADAVVHLAAASSVAASWSDVREANISGTFNVLEAARASGVPRVILASSNHVVGRYEPDLVSARRSSAGPATLDHLAPPRPDSLYGVSKGVAELLGRFFADVHGLRVVCLRIGTVLRSDDPLEPAPAEFASWGLVPWEVRIRGTWLSHRDCAELFRCAIDADVRFAIAYGVSDVPDRFWDLEEARRTLGFTPRDRWPEPPGPRLGDQSRRTTRS
jgi:nucleoside-diphosphate-sugar epimerase